MTHPLHLALPLCVAIIIPLFISIISITCAKIISDNVCRFDDDVLTKMRNYGRVLRILAVENKQKRAGPLLPYPVSYFF